MNGKKQGIFYGWVVTLCGAVVLGMTHGVVNNCFSQFIIPISKDLGVSRQAFSVCSTIICLLYALISFTSGFIYKRIRVRTTMRIASVTLPLFYGCYSLCRSLPAFYLCAAGAGISVSFLTFLPFSIIIANWFEEKRGQAIGLCFMGSGLGGMVMNAVSAVMLNSFGWRLTYLLTGILMLAIIFPLIWFVIRVTPEEMGMLPYGKGSGETGTPAVFGPKSAEAVWTVSFAALVGVALCNGLICNLYNNCIAPHLCDLGFSSLYAGWIVSAYMGGLAVGKITLGVLCDRMGARRGTAISMGAMILGFMVLILGRMQALHPLIVIGALGTASSNVSFPVLTRHAFGTRDYAAINGYLMGCTYITSSMTTVAANTIFSMTGTYVPALLAGIAASFLTVGLLFLVKAVKVPEAEKA